MKMAVYDAYDPYNTYQSSSRGHSQPPGGPPPPQPQPQVQLQPDHHGGGYRAPSLHDPGYRAPSIHDPYRTPNAGAVSESGYRTNYPGYPVGGSGPTSNGYDYGNPSAATSSRNSNGYRYSDYKPVPPPKSAPYKPVPPPKPKTSNASESNYMNSNGGGYASSVHYHSSNLQQQQQQNGQAPHRYDDDSGQGSSLDRDYGLYNKGQMNNHSKGQYYYNLPHQQNGGTPPRRESGLDLTNNREYRGSAFELYKKPLSEPRNPVNINMNGGGGQLSSPQHQSYPHYMSTRS